MPVFKLIAADEADVIDRGGPILTFAEEMIDGAIAPIRQSQTDRNIVQMSSEA